MGIRHFYIGTCYYYNMFFVISVGTKCAKSYSYRCDSVKSVHGTFKSKTTDCNSTAIIREEQTSLQNTTRSHGFMRAWSPYGATF